MKGASPLRRFPGIGVATLLVLIFLYLPILLLVGLSFNANRAVTVWSGFSFDWYGAVLDDPTIMTATKNSLIVAVAATLGATLLAIPAALATDRRFRGLGATLALFGVPLLVPEVVLAIASLLFFVLCGIRLSLYTVILAHIVFCFPFVYFPVRARLTDLNRSLLEAASDLYAGRWQTFRFVLLPLLWPGILAGAMLAFIISIDDFVTSFFVSGPGSTTLPVYIFSMVKAGVSPKVNAVSTMMLLVSVLVVCLSMLLARRR